MEPNNASEVSVLSTAEEYPETTVEIKIKTLDSQTYTLRVNRSMPVPALKEQVANVTGILSEQQRLICQGKVLKDDQLLSAYHVEDGHTLHLVVRQPPSASTAGSLGPEDASSHSGTNATLRTMRNQTTPSGRNVVFGTVNLADQGDSVNSEFGRVFSSLMSSFGFAGVGIGSEREGSYERPERTSGSGVSDPAETETNQSAARPEVNQSHSFRSPNLHSLGQHPTVIPDSLTTLLQYLSHMRCEFDANGREAQSSTEAANVHYPGRESDSSRSPLEQGGLPTPARLAEILLSARQLLSEQAAGGLYELATQLEGQVSMTDALERSSIQSNAVRSGVLLQHLGSLLLELGRTLMTLRMGRTPSEAVVNAGPAIFISSSAPNPLMVQAGTSFGGIPMGSLHQAAHGQGSGPVGSGFLSGNIDIRIHRGPSVATATTNVGQANMQQPLGTDTTTSSGETSARQAFQGLSANASIPRETGVRVVPLRTVVAVPSGVSPPPADSSGSAVGIFYPLLARFQQRGPGSSNEERVSQASLAQYSTGNGASHQQTPDYAAVGNVTSAPAVGSAHQAGASGGSNLSRPGTVGTDNDMLAHERQESRQESVAQMFSRFGEMVRDMFPREQLQNSETGLQGAGTDSAAGQTGATTDAEGQVAADGLFFSGLVRQLMPLISQNVTEAAGSSTDVSSLSSGQPNQNSVDLNSSQLRRDPPEAPESKRLKRE